MKLLLIDACPRGRDRSRTRALADAFVQAFLKSHADTQFSVADLPAMGLLPIDAAYDAARDRLIGENALYDPMFRPARAFAEADLIVVAAPYWDFSFPSMLKIYIEHIFARKITFVYDEHGPVGLCRARHLVYLTTSGSPIAENDWGGGYLRAISKILGIEHFSQVSAEGLDILGADAAGIVARAEARARRLGEEMAAALRA